MMSKILFLACLAIAHSLPVNEGNADKLVDQLLDTVKAKYGAQLDPLKMNATVAEFSKKIGIITFHGDAKLEDGVITGLKSLKRTGDATLTTDKGFDVKVQFGDNDIHVHYKAELQFMDLKTSGTLDVQLSNIDVKVDVDTTAAGKLEIKDFTVDALKLTKVDFKGPIPAGDEIVDLLGQSFVTIFNKQSRDLIGGLLKGIVQKELENLHL